MYVYIYIYTIYIYIYIYYAICVTSVLRSLPALAVQATSNRNWGSCDENLPVQDFIILMNNSKTFWGLPMTTNGSGINGGGRFINNHAEAATFSAGHRCANTLLFASFRHARLCHPHLIYIYIYIYISLYIYIYIYIYIYMYILAPHRGPATSAPTRPTGPRRGSRWTYDYYFYVSYYSYCNYYSYYDEYEYGHEYD